MALKIENVSKSFENKTLFSNFNVTFEENGLYSLVGASGTGKTTLLRMIAGLDKNFQGEITGGGIENVSFMFQEYRLFPTLSALENAIIPNGEMTNSALRDNATALFLRLGFTEDDMNLLPAQLSGGMKQRVSFIRSILRKTPILILDEPTKELDEAVRNEMSKIILSESKSRLVILVSHNENENISIDSKKIHLN